MDVDTLLLRAQDATAASRAFGEPIEHDGALLVPVALVMGGGGGGGEVEADEVEQGGGFGLIARPLGMFVVRGERVRFKPALGAGPVVLGLVLLVLLLGRRRRKRRRRDHRERLRLAAVEAAAEERARLGGGSAGSSGGPSARA